MSLRKERDNALAALRNMMGFFRSGNNIPVERATIRAKEREVQDAFLVLRNPRVRLLRKRGWRPRR